MKKHLIIILLVSLFFVNTLFADYTFDQIDSLHNFLKNPGIDYNRSAVIENFTFEWDAAQFSFNEGTIYSLHRINDQNIGLFFHGTGVMHLTSPNPVETFTIEKFTGNKQFEFEFDDALILFSPVIYDSLFDDFQFTTIKPKNKQRSTLNKMFDQMEDLEMDIGSEIIEQVFYPGEASFLQAIVKRKGKTYYYIYDLYSTESVALYEKKYVRAQHMLQPIAKLFPSSHYDNGGDIYEREQVVEIIPFHYTINSRIERDTDFSCRCRLKILANRDNIMNIELNHFYEIDIDSITDTNSNKLLYYNSDESPFTTIFFTQPFMTGDTIELDFHYHSKDIIKKSAWGDFYLRGSSSWYPSYGFLIPATFDLTFTFPEWLTLLSIGKKIKDTIDSDWRTTQWVTDEPVYNASFNYGFFDSLVVTEPGLPVVKVYRSDASHVAHIFGDDMLEVTGRDVTAALNFCENMFCDYPYDEILATEIPYFYHGTSWPGLLHLSWLSYETDLKNIKGHETDAFRAHEVAHQWWGHLIGVKSYHDFWLAEALAEYTSAWFIQAKDRDNKRFLDLIEAWQDNITQKGGGTGMDWSEGTDAGPIWLGYRLSSTESDDYGNLVYQKGAYILHMLRMMLHNYDTHSDENFINLMKTYARAYQGRKASTRNFQQLVDRAFNMDMSWFFDQYVFGHEVPEYDTDFDYIEENGKYFVVGTIRQEKVPENWKMVVPLVVEFENDTHTVLKFWVEGPLTEYKSAPLPYKPQNFIFNPYRAVLCR